MGFLALLFVLQMAIGIFVITHFIGGEMSAMLMGHVQSQLRSHQVSLENYVRDRLLLLRDYAAMPALVAGSMQPAANMASTVDFMENLSFLDESALFCLQDFAGVSIHASLGVPMLHLPEGPELASLIEGDMESLVSMVQVEQGGQEQAFWRFSVPVKYQGMPEGVLSAFVRVTLAPFLAEDNQDQRLAILGQEREVVSVGVVSPPVIRLRAETGYPGISLVQEVSRSKVEKRLSYLLGALIVALVVGAALFMLGIHLVSRKFFLIPHARLQTLTDELEREVQIRTADLQEKTQQLSLEIQDRRDAELLARETGQLLSALLEGIGAAFFIVEPHQGKIVRSNSVVRNMFGISPNDLPGDSDIHVYADQLDMESDLFCPNCIEERYSESSARHVDGHSFSVARYLVPMEIQEKPHWGILLLDITERKNLERRLGIAQKLESLGELASGVAHEINTPIQYVGDSVRFVEEAFEDVLGIMKAYDSLVRECVKDEVCQTSLTKIASLAEEADLEFIMTEVPKACGRALEGTDRVATIVRALKNFAHPGDGGRKAVDINQALENTILVAKNEWKYVAEIEKDFGDLPLVTCLAGDVNQVFLNILVNAAHAIEDVVGNSGEKGKNNDIHASGRR